MNLPGFTAESSLGKASTQYRSAANGWRSHPDAAVVSQLLSAGTAIWWPWRCPPGCIATGLPWRPCFCWSVQNIVAGPVLPAPGDPIEGWLMG